MPIIYRYRSKDFTPEEVGVVREQPFTIVVNGRELATLMSTPVKLDCLVLGFLAFEGIIRGLEDIAHLEVNPEEGLAEIRLRGSFTPPKRQIYTSGCSGGVTFSNTLLDHAPVLLERTLDPDRVFPLMRLLYEAATLYQQTRGVHAAALADDEKLLIVAEDVGRHNA
ncbi:MAG TPA: formate dehydrogenase accessory sulfurtransferase FdhD, partial [Candidatus Methylomirabilis sp.]|nr:formate dehydrogenase accessory sulfurtransferase FdhD [Candidatus Methylomirabilis sp.]